MVKLLTVAEVAERLRCRKETVRKYIAQGQLPARMLPGGYFRMREKDVENFLRPAAQAPETQEAKD